MACVVVSGGAALGAVVGICAVAGGIAAGAASAIVGAIDGEVSFGEVAGNFGIGFAVGAVTGAITGFTVGKIQLGAASKYDVGFGKGSFNSVNETINYHFGRHGAEVGAKNASQYLHKAIQVARDVVKNNIAPIRAVTGTTSNVYRYIVGDYYIHMAIEGAKIIIVSFGLRGWFECL